MPSLTKELLTEMLGAGVLALRNVMLVLVPSTVSRNIYFKAECGEPQQS
jgi:hypothetical protein